RDRRSQHAVRRHRRHRGRSAAARLLDVSRCDAVGEARRGRNGNGDVRRKAARSTRGRGVDDVDGAGRRARPRPRAAVPHGARDRQPDDARTRKGSERVVVVDAREGFGRSARYAAQLRRDAAREDFERASFRRGAADLRGTGAGGDGRRHRRVTAPTRGRRNVGTGQNERVVRRGGESGRAERRTVTRTYVRVIVLEVVIITLLWVVGRIYS